MSDQSYSALTDAIVRAIAANNFRVPTDLAGIKVDATLSGSTVANTAGVASKGVVQTIRSTIVNAQSVAAGGNGGGCIIRVGWYRIRSICVCQHRPTTLGCDGISATRKLWGKCFVPRKMESCYSISKFNITTSTNVFSRITKYLWSR